MAEQRDILVEICEQKRAHIHKQKKQFSENQLLNDIPHLKKPRPFRAPLLQKSHVEHIGLITEIKKASPSRGVIREDFEPRAIAEAYGAAGATCLSVLTDVPYFQGDDIYIEQVKSVVGLPVLRKDFMLDTYQIIESRAIGADCVLLIMAALENSQALELYKAAKELQMDVLVEVHDEYELERACTYLPVDMLGVNNRNLKTLEISLDVSKRLSKYIPKEVLRVAESGLKTHEDCKELTNYGMYSFLVGESLMSQKDIKTATQQLLGIKTEEAL